MFTTPPCLGLVASYGTARGEYGGFIFMERYIKSSIAICRVS
jgi:hypothetical protein